MALSLTPAEAQPKINQIDEEMHDVRTLANRILDSTQTMTASSWKGGRAAVFNQIMTQHHENMNIVINNLQRIVDKTKNDINAFIAHEAN
jgi:WXG100 family type VII secretion target